MSANPLYGKVVAFARFNSTTGVQDGGFGVASIVPTVPDQAWTVTLSDNAQAMPADVLDVRFWRGTEIAGATYRLWATGRTNPNILTGQVLDVTGAAAALAAPEALFVVVVAPASPTRIGI